jgi:hypothetical protein
MKPSVFASTSLAVASLLSAAAPAVAAPSNYDPDYARNAQDYENQRDAYARAQSDYAQNQADYARQRAEYEAAQRDYDARYGYGSYERRYGVFRYRGDVYDDRAYVSYSCRNRRDSNTAGGALLGAILGGVVGRNVAARGNRTEGTVVGALVGGVAGGAIGRSTARCDDSGYYYSYNDTVPYSSRYYGGRYDSSYYVTRRCRIAYAGDGNYVRVCPDRYGRYRITY